MVAAPAPAPIERSSGTGLRNGFSLSVGQEMGSGPSEGFSGQLYGVDWRIGAKVTPAISMYLQTHLSMGDAKIGNAEGVTGNFAAALMGEYELPQRVFFAGGGGYGVLNNPSGPMGQLRAGWYPMKGGDGVERRINLALDARFYFPGDDIGRVTQLSLTIGYDRF